MSTDSPRLWFEILKLLLQVAWADDDVADHEREHILSLAREAGLDAAEQTMLDDCLCGKSPLPAPDMGFLRAHREAALAAAETLMVSDQKVVEDEAAVLAQLHELLGG